jgi:gliding motility associated protien GldN
MRKLAIVILTGVILILGAGQMNQAQDLTTGSIYEKENVPNRKPVPLPHLREADITWSKMLWRMVDLREKINQPLYFPTAPFGARMSLIDALLAAVENGEISVYTDDQFKTIKDVETVKAELGGEPTTETVVDVDTGLPVTVEVPGEVRTFEVREYLILEQWYFDKQRSRFDSRIIGLCPIRVSQRKDDQGNDTEETVKRQIFWVYYPDAREILARHEVLTGNNDLSSTSFDDIFLQRRFSGYIYRESNIHDNRAIQDYAHGRDALYESERIKNMIFNLEQDLWEY